MNYGNKTLRELERKYKVEEDYSYDKSQLFKTRLDTVYSGYSLRDLLKVPFQEVKEEVYNGNLDEKYKYETVNEIESWYNKNSLPPKDQFIAIEKMYKLYVNDELIREFDPTTDYDESNLKCLNVSNSEIGIPYFIYSHLEVDTIYTYKNLTKIEYEYIYNFVYNFVKKYANKEVDYYFKYMLNEQIDIRHEIIENKDQKYKYLKYEDYNRISLSIHQQLQKKFMEGNIDIEKYNYYFKKLITEVANINNFYSSLGLNFPKEEHVEQSVVINNHLFIGLNAIKVLAYKNTAIKVGNDIKYVLPYHCNVKKINNSHYELSYEYIKHDLYIDNYLIYLNNELIATYLDLGVNELEHIKNIIIEKHNSSGHDYFDLYWFEYMRLASKLCSEKQYKNLKK